MATGDVVFSRALEDDKSDIWDDTALIKAYDEAVNSMKAEIAGQLGETGDKRAGETKKKHKKKRRNHKNKDKIHHPVASVGPTQWKVGDRCRTVYTSDGQIYEAVVIEVDHEDQTCTVRYLGYGNEEDHSLEDLLLTREHTDTRSLSEGISECDSFEWSHHGKSPRGTPQPRGHGHHGSVGRGVGRGWGAPPPPPPFMTSAGSSHMMGDFMPPMMPPMFPPTVGLPPFGNMQMPTPGMAGMPDFPPPPFPDDPDDVPTDSEALHSMLISCYMSGYHTGYYQGLKQGRKGAKKGRMCSSAERTEAAGDPKTQNVHAHSRHKGNDDDVEPSIPSD